MNKIRQDQITTFEEQPLSGIDLSSLCIKRNKQIIFLGGSYLTLTGVLLQVAWERVDAASAGSMSIRIMSNVFLLSPVLYTCAFFFLLLTIFFVYYYLQSVAPLVRDIRHKKKLVLYYIPEKTEMFPFNRFYISTPVIKKQLIEVNREDFNIIPVGKPMIIEIAPKSSIILRFRVNEREIKADYPANLE